MSVSNEYETCVKTFLPKELRIALIAVACMVVTFSGAPLYNAFTQGRGFSLIIVFIAFMGIYIGGRIGLGALLSFNEEWHFKPKKIEIRKTRGEIDENKFIFLENIKASEILQIEYESAPDAFIIELTEANGARHRSPKFKTHQNAQFALDLFLGKPLHPI